MLVDHLSDHTKWCFFDEKHLSNKDVLPDKLRANPLTGMVDAIPVAGNFWESYDMITGISVNVFKKGFQLFTPLERRTARR